MIQANINNRWAQLSQGEKAELLGIYTRAGYNDLASIIAHYNSCGGKLKADGGPIGSSGWNAARQLIDIARRKYLTDYVNNGEVYGYPGSEVESSYGSGPNKGVVNYLLSPYTGRTHDDNDASLARRALLSEYTGIKEGLRFDPNDYIEVSPYRPNVSKDANAKYFRMKARPDASRRSMFDSVAGSYKIDHGIDENGRKYVSFYDQWDLSPFSKDRGINGNDIPGTKPVELYDRIYEDEDPDYYYRVVPNEAPEEYRKKRQFVELKFGSGGKIHIKPENRGKFTALKKRTGHSASWFKEHGTPAQKKMAVFALNARKWKHADGGPLGEENETQINHIPNWTVFGTDYSTWKPSDIQSIIDWGYTDPESFFGEEGENTRNALSRAGMADSVIGDIYANMDPELQSKFGDRYKGTKQRQQEYTGGITNAIDSAGQRIYQIADTVAGFVPGPVGMIDWLGHMGADVAEGEFGKVGKDLALAAGLGFGARALGKGARYLKNYWDEIGNFGEDTFRAFTDDVPDRVSDNFIYAAPSTRAIAKAVPAVSKAASTPYEIENLGGGYMLKSLMRGNPLEKQINKNGTVNVNNVRALVGKGSKVEQTVIDKVLTSDEFAGKKSIDYNKFRKAVQDELITYERTPNSAYESYGAERIGIVPRDGMETLEAQRAFLRDHPELNWSVASGYDGRFEKTIPTDYGSYIEQLIPEEEVNAMFPGWRNQYAPPRSATTNTYTFSSSRIPNGSGKHYDPNTLGHSRTYTTTDEPNVLHVMESQSDWAQSGKAVSRSEIENQIASLKQSLAMQEENLKNNGRYFAPKVRNDVEGNIDYLKEQIAEYNARLKDADQVGYLSDNFTSRQIQENLRYAAEKGQKKMRYPTRETAAKIEGYPEREAYFNEKGEEIGKIRYEPQEVSEQRASLYTFGEEIDKEIAELQSGVKKYDDLISAWQGIPPEDPLDDLAMRDNERRWESYCSYLKFESKTGSPGTQERMAKLYDEEVSMFENKFGHKPNVDKDIAEIEEALRESDRMHSRLLKLSEGEAKLRPGITKKTVYDYEDILRKYTEFPKQYKKLYKNADVRTVIDPKGNSWYEVDVPENYLQQEWAYKNGGPLREFANVSDLF